MEVIFGAYTQTTTIRVVAALRVAAVVRCEVALVSTMKRIVSTQAIPAILAAADGVFDNLIVTGKI
jgi:hypothetical protein